MKKTLILLSILCSLGFSARAMDSKTLPPKAATVTDTPSKEDNQASWLSFITDFGNQVACLEKCPFKGSMSDLLFSWRPLELFVEKSTEAFEQKKETWIHKALHTYGNGLVVGTNVPHYGTITAYGKKMVQAAGATASEEDMAVDLVEELVTLGLAGDYCAQALLLHMKQDWGSMPIKGTSFFKYFDNLIANLAPILETSSLVINDVATVEGLRKTVQEIKKLKAIAAIKMADRKTGLRYLIKYLLDTSAHPVMWFRVLKFEEINPSKEFRVRVSDDSDQVTSIEDFIQNHAEGTNERKEAILEKFVENLGKEKVYGSE